MDNETVVLWVGFNLFVLALLALDLGVFHRRAHVVSLREATAWSIAWITLALVFNLGLYLWRGSETALAFFTGYLVEKSLSIDNIFVFVLIFSAFAVPAASRHRVLFYGILGALVMRGLFILVGSAMLIAFHWIIYLFGAFLILTGIRMVLNRRQEPHPEKNPIIKAMRRILPMASEYDRDHFFVRSAGRWLATPLVLVLAVVESTDLLFAVDSIPAVLAITPDPFIAYTSNVFAMLGLRSLYFVFADIIHRFRYLKFGLAAILVFVGVKMLLADVYEIPIPFSLAVIATLLAAAITVSLLHTRRMQAASSSSE